MIVVLTSVGLLSGGFLATVGILTKERIAANKQKEIEDAILTVVPGTESSQKLYEEKDLSVYGGKDNKGTLLGFAIYASGVGFQDKITLMFGTDPRVSRIRRLTILDQKETPGLGAKITDQESFLKYWKDKDCTQPLSLHKPATSSPEELGTAEVNTITGATISSEAVLNTVNLSLDRLRRLKSEGKLASEDHDAN
jgi:RnfABCDGE-type electron transport complex G subunit